MQLGLPETADIRYATAHGIKLGIAFQDLGDKDLEAARQKAFRDACLVWNAIDQSTKHRIKVVDSHVNIEMHVVNEAGEVRL